MADLDLNSMNGKFIYTIDIQLDKHIILSYSLVLFSEVYTFLLLFPCFVAQIFAFTEMSAAQLREWQQNTLKRKDLYQFLTDTGL